MQGEMQIAAIIAKFFRVGKAGSIHSSGHLFRLPKTIERNDQML
jgi:hypothetical protein